MKEEGKFVSCFEDVFDLNDLSIYPEDWKNKESSVLWELAEEKAGRALFYMEFLHPGYWWGDQRQRVFSFCKKLSNIRIKMIKDSPENRLIIMKWMFRFDDEVENMC